MTKDQLLGKNENPLVLAQNLVWGHFSTQERESLGPKLANLLNNWEGREVDVISILHHATLRGKAEEYVGKLEKIHTEYLSHLPTTDGIRRDEHYSGVRHTNTSVNNLYNELEIQVQY